MRLSRADVDFGRDLRQDLRRYAGKGIVVVHSAGLRLPHIAFAHRDTASSNTIGEERSPECFLKRSHITTRQIVSVPLALYISGASRTSLSTFDNH